MSTSIHAKGLPINDDPTLEGEADVLGAKAAGGGSVATGVSTAPVIGAGAPVQAKMDSADDGGTPLGDFMVSTEEATESPAQTKRLAAPAQARGLGPIQRQKKKSFVPHQVTITRQLTLEEFRVAAMIQIFGGNAPKVEWHNTMKTYAPGTYQVDVESSLLERGRGEVAKSKGISVGDDGVVAADKRASAFDDQPASDAKTAVMNEIDRRYYEASGTNTKVKAGEKGKGELWFQIRDEVLFCSSTSTSRSCRRR